MSKQQTAVEWLMSNLKLTIPQSQFNDVVIQDLFKLAKRMEKQQIINACEKFNTRGYVEQDYIEYYESTFKP